LVVIFTTGTIINIVRNLAVSYSFGHFDIIQAFGAKPSKPLRTHWKPSASVHCKDSLAINDSIILVEDLQKMMCINLLL
jgi:hypothetical protein